MKDTQPILILSTGRTGTIFLARLFADLFTDVAAYHERGNSRPVQIATNLYFSRLLPRKSVKITWRLLKGNEIYACKKPYHLDANNFLYGLASLFPEVYPGLRVLHIVRDPRTYVTSQLNFSRQKFTSFIGNHLVPFWQPNPFLVGELPFYKFSSFSRFERYCWVWDFKNRIISKLEGSETPYLRVRFEDLFSVNSDLIFRQITEFLRLPPVEKISDKFREPANSSKSTYISEWNQWSPKQARQLHSLCGTQMEKFGYGKEENWLKKIKPYL